MIGDMQADVIEARFRQIGEAVNREIVIQVIVKAEWNQFQKVRNEGGRASCQDDWETFEIMRKSQFQAWTDGVLESYMEDLRRADEGGWNLVMEKYMRMMASTAPERYREFEPILPERSGERMAKTEEMVGIGVRWAEEFAGLYPGLGAAGRAIHTSDDGSWDTSYETYLRGELLTYSDETFGLYCDMVQEYCEVGKSMTMVTRELSVKMYGYESLEAAERKARR